MHTGKAAGIDLIHAEMLNTDLLISTRALTILFRNIWNGENIPSDWIKGWLEDFDFDDDLAVHKCKTFARKN